MPRPSVLTAGLLALALALGACSSSDSADPAATDAPTSTSTETGTAAPSAPAAVDLPDGIAARVGDTDIAAADLQARYDLAIEIPQVSQQLEQGDATQIEGQLKAQLLSEMVLQEIVLQGAAAEGIEITDEQVAAERATLVEEAGSEDAFAESLRSAAVPEGQVDGQLRASLALQAVTEQRVGDQATESPSEATESPSEATEDPSASPTAPATPSAAEQQAQQAFFLEAVQSLQVEVDGEFGTWDAQSGRVVPA